MENEPELELIEHNPVFQAIVSVAVYEKAFKWHAYRPPSANYRSNPHVEDKEHLSNRNNMLLYAISRVKVPPSSTAKCGLRPRACVRDWILESRAYYGSKRENRDGTFPPSCCTKAASTRSRRRRSSTPWR
ncbi:hypothetical protein Salat_2968600 [Sesamum alatum]|uniref:Uncharacterized protein n=1 Tax=Sesamum alatum TaxID=300844 RepID=A0AAE1XHU4_9LAMI|nr:hypothetical protein Salat_2968600 [Sesamum alatum]